MPTARELLEQADALMRRNRNAVADDIPVLTEAVSPKPTFRVPLRPSPESPPVPLADDGDEPAAAADMIPTLTEKVPAGEGRDEGAVLAEGEPSDWLDFDEGEPSVTGKAPVSVLSVPEVVTAEALREAADADETTPPAVEEIELAPAADAAFEAELGGAQDVAPAASAPADADSEGVASDEFASDEFASEDVAPEEVTSEGATSNDAASEDAASEDAASEDAASEDAASEDAASEDAASKDASAGLGTRATTSWAVTPWPQGELPPEVEALPGLAAEAELVFESPTSVSWNVEAALSGPAGEREPQAVPAAPAAEPPAMAFTAPPATEADEPALPVPAEVSLAPSPAEAFAPVPRPDALAGEAPAVPEAAASESAVEMAQPPAAEGQADTVAGHATALAAPAAVPAAMSAPFGPDDARWDAMAEEIRMQVLQRIDLFTDTGLREQLGQHLQPIVDRASADLVATINQHVGELLRAYVAEAIEREIERWRETH